MAQQREQLLAKLTPAPNQASIAALEQDVALLTAQLVRAAKVWQAAGCP